MLSWQQTEFLLKGVYLGLLVMIAWLEPRLVDLAFIGLATLGGLVLFLGVAAVRKYREGFRPRGNWLGYLIFMLLENPGTVYAGLIVGLAVGTVFTFNHRGDDPITLESLWPVLGGGALGAVFYNIRYVKQPAYRIWISLAMAALLVGGTVALFHYHEDFFKREPAEDFVKKFMAKANDGKLTKDDLSDETLQATFDKVDTFAKRESADHKDGVVTRGELEAFDKLRGKDRRFLSGVLLLLGIPGFFLLTFAGLVEESEIEIGAMCAALGIGMWALLAGVSMTMSSALVVILPAGIFFIYTTRILPYLRVLKHALRGMSYRRMGHTRLALMSLGRALQLDPGNPLARREMWDLHRDLDFASLQHQPELVPFLHFDFCLERISQMLQTKPGAAEMAEIVKMLDLIEKELPAKAPVCAYWRAVARLHEHHYEEAAAELFGVLQLPQYYTLERQAIHYAAWLLAMYAHPEMTLRVGQVLLPRPGQHMDAIAAVETQLAKTPDDPTAKEMRRQLYSELTEREYWSIAQPGQPPPILSHDYARDVGVALLGDSQQWQRGCAYLRIAANGMPLQGATLYIQIAQAHEKHGDKDGLWQNYQKAMQIGRNIGVQNLQTADKEALFATVKKIGEQALTESRLDAALEAFKFYSQYESAGIETYRTLAGLFEKLAERAERNKQSAERTQNLWLALHCCEHALSYNAEDRDLLARKDRYYYSIQPDELKERLESVRKWFDPQYCRDKARWVLEKGGGDPELLDWAAHLTQLALVAQPGSHAARLLKARVCRLRGETAETLALLEEVRQHKPEKFVNDEEEKAWYFTHRMLGDLYLDEKPDQAILCYTEFRQSDEAGADTSYKLGRAYEASGDLARAAACYEEVTAYERHPLFYEAREALDRVRRGAPAAR